MEKFAAWIIFSMNDPLIEIDQNQYLQNQGSEVNGLVQFKTRWIFWFFSLFQKNLELFDENYGYEMAWRWLYSKTKAEDFCLGRIILR